MTVVNHYRDGTLREEEWRAHSAGMAYVANSRGGVWLLENSIVTPDVLAALHESVDEDLEQKDRFLGIPMNQAVKQESVD
jgi:hypothetical protein